MTASNVKKHWVTSSVPRRLEVESFLVTHPNTAVDVFQATLFLESMWGTTRLENVTWLPVDKKGRALPAIQHPIGREMVGGERITAKYDFRGDAIERIDIKADEISLGTIRRAGWPLNKRWVLSPA